MLLKFHKLLKVIVCRILLWSIKFYFTRLQVLAVIQAEMVGPREHLKFYNKFDDLITRKVGSDSGSMNAALQLLDCRVFLRLSG